MLQALSTADLTLLPLSRRKSRREGGGPPLPPCRRPPKSRPGWLHTSSLFSSKTIPVSCVCWARQSTAGCTLLAREEALQCRRPGEVSVALHAFRLRDNWAPRGAISAHKRQTATYLQVRGPVRAGVVSAVSIFLLWTCK